jgi:hypothetical protein
MIIWSIVFCAFLKISLMVGCKKKLNDYWLFEEEKVKIS